MLKATGTFISEWTDRAPGRGLVLAMLFGATGWVGLFMVIKRLF